MDAERFRQAKGRFDGKNAVIEIQHCKCMQVILWCLKCVENGTFSQLSWHLHWAIGPIIKMLTIHLTFDLLQCNDAKLLCSITPAKSRVIVLFVVKGTHSTEWMLCLSGVSEHVNSHSCKAQHQAWHFLWIFYISDLTAIQLCVTELYELSYLFVCLFI